MQLQAPWHLLEVLDSGNYLGVRLTYDLTWHKYVDATVTISSKTIGFLRPNLRECTMQAKSAAYISVVRPTIEYSSVVRDPSSLEDINKLRLVQRQVVHFVHNNYFDRTPTCVSKKVSDITELATLCKIQLGLV